MSFLTEKNLVLEFYKALQTSDIEDTKKVFLKYCSKDLIWRGFHPFNKVKGCGSVCELFWNPLKSSLSSLTRRMDIFFAGNNTISDNEGVWVASMGHLMGLFDKPWLKISPNKKLTFLKILSFKFRFKMFLSHFHSCYNHCAYEFFLW